RLPGCAPISVLPRDDCLTVVPSAGAASARLPVTAAPIMLQVLEKVFAKNVATPEWQAKIRQIVPSYGEKLNDDPEKVAQSWAYTSEQLQLPAPPTIDRGPLKPTPVSDTVLSSSDTPVKGPVHDLAP
ncbi:malate:quinone oxidoreductase, partial [Methylobacterium tarhaniae]|uniref:malate:quinone oxidoreductase n=1 Tax=Methylobacterium tarhaniae TaxID=1187852 RepID=UPI003D027A25